MFSQLEQYQHNQKDIVKKHNGKIIAVKDGNVLGEFPTKTDALKTMLKKYEPGTFLILKCSPGEEEYTRRFRTRVQLEECPAI
jgi:hypothetical protein